MVSQFLSQNHGNSKKKSLYLKFVHDLSDFFQNSCLLCTWKPKNEAKKSQTKFLMPQGHPFAAQQCTCCGTAVWNHCSRLKLTFDKSAFPILRPIDECTAIKKINIF